jgi:hypothetical protein
MPTLIYSPTRKEHHPERYKAVLVGDYGIILGFPKVSTITDKGIEKECLQHTGIKPEIIDNRTNNT